MSAWERALQGIGGGGNAVVAARNRDAQRRMTQARVAASPNRPGARPSGVTFPTAGFVPTAGFGPGFQPSNEDYASAGRMAGQIGQEILFGPERQSWIPGQNEASRLERFGRDWFTAEQERNLAAQAGREGRVGAALGWGGLAAAGLIPFGRIFRGIRTAGNVAETAADASRAMPSGPPPTPPVRSWDPWSSDPMPEGWSPLSSTGRPIQRRPISDEYFAEMEAREQALMARRAEQARQADEAERIRKAEEARLELEALRSLQRALVVPTTPQLPYAASLSRSGPLADLRLFSGTGGVESGTVPSIHNFPIPFRAVDPDAPMRLPETMGEPFVEAGIMRPRDIQTEEINRILGTFKTLGASGRGGQWNPRTSTEIERRAVQSILNDIMPEYSGRFRTIPLDIYSRPRSRTGGRDFPFENMQSGWTTRATEPINTLVRRQMVEDIAGNLGINPYMWSPTDIRTLEGLLNAIKTGTPSSVMHVEGLDYLLREGIAPTATRVGRSGAGPDSFNRLSPDREQLRAATEYGNFGIPVNAGPEARPHYGFIQSRPGAPEFRGSNIFNYETVRPYGPVVAEWSNDIRPQTSFVVGDSLNAMLPGNMPLRLPRPLQNPTIQDVAFAGGYDLPTAGYVETQMFGGPTIENLMSLRVAENYADEVARLLQRYGVDVPVSTIEGNWNKPFR